MLAAETWKIVPSVPGLAASSFGRVMILPSPSSCGRAYHGSLSGGRYHLHYKHKTYMVSRLVCEAFNGPPPFERAVCMHKNENSRDNIPTNLQWGTQKENLNAPGFLEYCRSRTGENNPFIKGRKVLAPHL